MKRNTEKFYWVSGIAVFSLVLLMSFQNAKKYPSPSPTPSPSLVPSPTFSFTVNDPDNLLGDKKALMLANAQAAANLWAKEFNSSVSLEVKIDVLQTPNNRFGGQSVAKQYIGTYNGHYVAEENAVYELRTGKDPNGTMEDISIWVDPDYLNNEMWLDPHPDLRTDPVPSNRLDGVSVFMHELGHALGFNGYWSGNVPPADNWIGVYDKFISTDANGNRWYVGPNGVAAYGAPIPICKEVVYHIGDISTALADRLDHNLMTGNYFMYGYRYNIDAFDRAILKDIGAPLK
jgi:hypothetical protein